MVKNIGPDSTLRAPLAMHEYDLTAQTDAVLYACWLLVGVGRKNSVIENDGFYSCMSNNIECSVLNNTVMSDLYVQISSS